MSLSLNEFNILTVYIVSYQIEGILPKGPYPPCLRMADRALLAGYPQNMQHVFVELCSSVVVPLFLVDPYDLLTHIFQGCLTGTGAIIWLPCASAIILKDIKMDKYQTLKTQQSESYAYLLVYVVTVSFYSFMNSVGLNCHHNLHISHCWETAIYMWWQLTL